MREKPLLLLVNLGTPDAPEPAALRRYLKEFLSDPRVVSLPGWLWKPILYGVILPFRAPRSAAAYRAIWQAEGSPLLHHSRRLCRALEERLAGRAEVRLAMRYGRPSLAEVLDECPADQVFILPLYPQYSSTTTASVLDAFAHWAAGRVNLPGVGLLRDYHDHPRYIEALADSIRRAWKDGQGQRLLFSFHGIPRRLVRDGDPYEQQCRRTASLVAESLQLPQDRWQVMFQSRFGREQWLEPYAVDTLSALPSQGITEVDVICPGFAVDCLETLEEMARENRQLFLAAGGSKYRYIPCLNDSPAQVTLLAELFEDHAHTAAG